MVVDVREGPLQCGALSDLAQTPLVCTRSRQQDS